MSNMCEMYDCYHVATYCIADYGDVQRSIEIHYYCTEHKDSEVLSCKDLENPFEVKELSSVDPVIAGIEKALDSFTEELANYVKVKKDG